MKHYLNIRHRWWINFKSFVILFRRRTSVQRWAHVALHRLRSLSDRKQPIMKIMSLQGNPHYHPLLPVVIVISLIHHLSLDWLVIQRMHPENLYLSLDSLGIQEQEDPKRGALFKELTSLRQTLDTCFINILIFEDNLLLWIQDLFTGNRCTSFILRCNTCLLALIQFPLKDTLIISHRPLRPLLC